MTQQLIQFETEDGELVTIETALSEGDRAEIELVSDDGEQSVHKASKTFEGALKQIKPATKALFGAFQELNHPSNIELEFGVKIGGKASVIFASADSEATFKVKLSWNNQ